MLVHRRVTPALSSPVPIYTPGWREALWEYSVLPKNTIQCHRPGLEPGPHDPETSALTMRPPRLPWWKWPRKNWRDSQINAFNDLHKLFSSCLLPLIKESACKTIHTKMCSLYRFFFMQMKFVFIWKVLQEDSFWTRSTRYLENGLLGISRILLLY